MLLYNQSELTIFAIFFVKRVVPVLLTLSWRRLLSSKNQSIDLQCKSMDWFLYDNSLHHERVKVNPGDSNSFFLWSLRKREKNGILI